MSIQFTAEVRGDLLMVTTTGQDDSVEEVQDYGREVIARALASGVTKVLCDERQLRYQLDVASTYEAAKAIAEYAPQVGRAAIVCRPEDRADGEFWEDVAVNRGLCVCVTTDLAAALAWLAADGAAEAP